LISRRTIALFLVLQSVELKRPLRRHARACRGHPRLYGLASTNKTWMAGTSPAMTSNTWFELSKT
jgi:hypothetical protein